MEHHHRLLRELGATDAAHLRGMVPGQKVLLAGVRASTQTPPIPSGKRIIFCTLEDGSGLVDIALFADSHEHVAHTVFHSELLLVRGQVEARGPRRTVVGEMAWDLDEVAAARRDHGPQAALDLLGRTSPAPTPAQPATPQRTLADGTAGARLHPYAGRSRPVPEFLEEIKTVSYVVRRTLTRYGAGNVELDRAGRLVGDRQAADPGAASAATGRRNGEHS